MQTSNEGFSAGGARNDEFLFCWLECDTNSIACPQKSLSPRFTIDLGGGQQPLHSIARRPVAKRKWRGTDDIIRLLLRLTISQSDVSPSEIAPCHCHVKHQGNVVGSIIFRAIFNPASNIQKDATRPSPSRSSRHCSAKKQADGSYAKMLKALRGNTGSNHLKRPGPSCRLSRNNAVSKNTILNGPTYITGFQLPGPPTVHAGLASKI
ncbi:hypothetical protein CISG_06222 [Coccidioides immitis RMSCC 3703]|uniref:Uncharacterized protein n=1 Tax=Coccidioides immitis RMSCC 3703 TaxID=454286 RepID=A0A0J8TT64_COCIT|nr:hypothetical protein CISG_06222 [Coccidioides immitis RMSCC 3703]